MTVRQGIVAVFFLDIKTNKVKRATFLDNCSLETARTTAQNEI